MDRTQTRDSMLVGDTAIHLGFVIAAQLKDNQILFTCDPYVRQRASGYLIAGLPPVQQHLTITATLGDDDDGQAILKEINKNL